MIAALASPAHSDPNAELADHLAKRWAPVYVQHVDDDDGGADRPTRFDFDGNWDATDNWDNQARFGTALPPAAYGAAVLTSSHAYLTYTLFYPRDWSRICIALVCHDNDLETVQLVVERDADAGKLVSVRTKAHHSMDDIPAAEVARTGDGRPLLKVESQGHGIAVCRADDPECEPLPGRLVYAPGTVASPPPTRALGQTVHYELLSLRDTLWARRDRAHSKLWTKGETGPLYYHGVFRGRRGNAMGAAVATSRFDGGVRPPWALAGRTGKRGDWFLDPAAEFDEDVEYVFNPYLADLDRECTGARCTPAPPEPARWRYYARSVAPYAVMLIGAVMFTGFVRSRDVF